MCAATERESCDVKSHLPESVLVILVLGGPIIACAASGWFADLTNHSHRYVQIAAATVPFTFLAGVCGFVAWREFRKERPRRPRVCFFCGYSLQGLRIGSTCPECGRES